MTLLRELKDKLRAIRRRVFPEVSVRLLRRELAGMESVLDVGCGSESRLRFVEGIPRKVGVDAFEPSVEKARALGIHHEYIITPLDKLDIPDASFDAVILMDLIEHFPKEESERFLERIERIAKKKVIVFTPNGFLAQPAYDNNPWQEHLCGWDVDDFEKRGYRVEGSIGFKWLRGMYHLPRLRPMFIGEVIANTTYRLWTRRHPRSDAALFAIKDKGNGA